MERTFQFFLTVHLVGVVFWVGGLALAVRLLRRVAQEPDVPARLAGTQHVRHLMRYPDLGMAMAALGGVYLLLAHDAFFLRQPFMHLKLLLVAAMIATHVVARIKAKRLTQGATRVPAAMASAVMVLAVLIVTVVVFRVP